MMKRNWAGIAICLMVLLFSCGNGSKNAEGGKSPEVLAPDNDLVVGMFNDVQGLDPHAISSTVSRTVIATMYESLVGFDPDGRLLPALAERWEVSSDNLSYTFYLRRGVKFHDGTPFNAEAFRANYRRGVENTGIRLHGRIATWESVEAKDEYTVVIKLKEPHSSFLGQLTQIVVISPKAIAENDLQKKPSGTGPYIFKERVDGDHVTVVPYADYWGPKPTVASLTFRAILEDGSRVAAIQTGECDFVYRMPAIQAPVINGTDNIEIISKPSNVMRYVTLNTRLPQLSDKRVRQALNYAINKPAYIKTVFNGFGVEVNSIYPPTIPYYVPQTPYTFNIEKAKTLLAEAGYPNGFELNIWGDTTSIEQVAMQFVQQQLAQVGVTVHVMPMDPNVINSQIYVDDSKMTIQTWYVNWSSSSMDVDGAVRNILYSKMKPPASANTAYYNNPKFDILLDQARATLDPAKLTTIYAELQAIAWDEAPWLFMGSDNVIAAKKTYLTGAELYTTGALDFSRASLKLK